MCTLEAARRDADADAHGEILAVSDAACERTEAAMKPRTRRAAWWPPPHRPGGKASAHRLLCSSRADGSRSPSTTARPISGTAAAAVASVNHHHHHRHRSAAVQPGELQPLPDPFERACSCASLTQPIDSCHGRHWPSRVHHLLPHHQHRGRRHAGRTGRVRGPHVRDSVRLAACAVCCTAPLISGPLASHLTVCLRWLPSRAGRV